MRTPPITPGQPCTDCGRPMRSSKTTELQYPGTISHHTGGKCGRCHQRKQAGPKNKKISNITPYQPCNTCDRPLRPQRSTTTDYPGTVQHSSKGTCAVCANRIRNANKPRKPRKPRGNTIAVGQPCNTCGKPMRPRRMSKAEAPNTIIHWAAGHCDTCHKTGKAPTTGNPDKQTIAAKKATPKEREHYRKRQQLPPRPDGLTPDELHTRRQIEELIESRRRRGIPPEGLIPQEMGLAA